MRVLRFWSVAVALLLSAGAARAQTVAPGYVFVYHPYYSFGGAWWYQGGCQPYWGWYWYPAIGYSAVPAYYTVRPDPAAREPEPPRPVKPIDVTGLSPDAAEGIFWRGYELYWQRRYAAALVHFRAAVTLLEADARFWSYKALAEWALGKNEAARASAVKAAAFRKQGMPDPVEVGHSLERVQGPARKFLEAARE
jgi:hypothetical protein